MANTFDFSNFNERNYNFLQLYSIIISIILNLLFCISNIPELFLNHFGFGEIDKIKDFLNLRTRYKL